MQCGGKGGAGARTGSGGRWAVSVGRGRERAGREGGGGGRAGGRIRGRGRGAGGRRGGGKSPVVLTSRGDTSGEQRR
jgi:hypothetical protein